ncbi:MAG: NUDIX domain-containing protein [Labedaea sp.]
MVGLSRNDGDRFTRCAQGHVHWGRFGAAGLMIYHDEHVLLQRRSWWTPGRNSWALFGGARHRDEEPVATALRETAEESTLPPDAARVHGIITEDHGNWAYHTVFGTVPALLDVRPGSRETRAAAWVPVSEVDQLRLFTPFERTWPRLRDGLRRPVLVVDCANVMGSRADKWWLDRAGAAARLRDELAPLTERGCTAIHPFDRAHPEIVLVVEGRARGIGSGATKIRVVDAERIGDDTIVALVSEPDPDARYLVITADRALRARCEAAGAQVTGPRWLLRQLSTE